MSGSPMPAAGILRPRTAGNLAAAGRPSEPRKNKVEQTKKTDASKWSAEVVRALCRRLPGGDETLTARCEICKCIAWPCLCAVESPRGSRLRPPRVLQEYERRARKPNPESHIHPQSHSSSPLGNLRYIRSRVGGMNPDRLHVVSTADADAIGGTAARHSSLFIKANVLSRRADQYVLELEGMSDWHQDVELNGSDLQSLLDGPYLNDELSVVEDVYLKSTEKTIVYSDRNEAEKDFGLMQVNEHWYVKEVWSSMGSPPRGKAYKSGVRAGNKLVNIQDRSLEAAMEEPLDTDDERDVHDHSWSRYLPGIFDLEQGASLTHPGAGEGDDEPTDLSATLRNAPLSPSLSGSGRFRYDSGSPKKNKTLPAKRCGGEEGLSFPCMLTFLSLPRGWCVTGVKAAGEQRLDIADTSRLKNKLRELADAQKQVTLSCMCLYSMVSRTDFNVRHEHVWEKVLNTTREDDAQMLTDWCLTAHLTPAQLSFTFKEVRESLRTELELFDRERLRTQEMLVSKVMRIVDMKRDCSASMPDQGARDLRGTLPKQKGIDKGIETTTREIRFVLQQVPLHFLVELHRACCMARDNNGAVPTSPKNTPDGPVLAQTKNKYRKSSFSCFDLTSDTTCNRDKLQRDQTKKQMKQLMQLVTSLPSVARGSQCRAIRDMRERQTWMGTDGMRSASKAKQTSAGTDVSLGDTADLAAQSTVLEFFELLLKHTSDALAAGKKGKLQSAGFVEKGAGVLTEGSNSSPLIQKSASVAAKDGRMSKRDFANIMVRSGITWLTSAQLESNFKTMDKDGSGFLNISEVLVFSERIMELLLLVKDFQMDLEAAGERTAGQKDLMQRFVTKLTLGGDLVGGVHRKVIGDDCIEVYPKPQTDNFSMERTRLDYMGVPWMAEMDGFHGATEDVPFIEWRFSRQMWITAVVTRGDPRPGHSNWVTEFDLMSVETEGIEGDDIEMRVCYSCDNANVDGIKGAWCPLTVPVKAVKIRLAIRACKGMPALRATLFGQAVED